MDPSAPKSHYRRPATILGANLLLFTLARLVLYLVNRQDFHALSGLELVESFWRGIWFDACLIARIVGVPMLLLALPFAWAQNRWWQGVWGWLCLAPFILFIAIFAVDIVYLRYVHRHIGLELSYVSWEEAKSYATEGHAWAGLAFLVLGSGMLLAWWRVVMRFPSVAPARKKPHLGILLALIAVTAVVFRGGIFLRKSLHVGDAFDGVSLASGMLTVSGPFSSLIVLSSIMKRDRFIENVDFYPWEQALEEVRVLATAPGEVPVDPEYPLLRRRPSRGAGRTPNMVVLMLEGWDAENFDCIRAVRGEPPLGLTPRFDALAREGVLLTRCYSSGERSLEGLYALTTGHPTLPGLPYLGAGLELTAMPYIGHLAQDEGYATYFLQATGRHFQRVHSAASLVGFQVVKDGEDMPIETDVRPEGEGIAWDHELCHEAHRILTEAARGEQPFLAYVFTAATHEPFNWPSDEYRKIEPRTEKDRYLNSLYYADDAVGWFMQAARDAGWYEDTIFLLVADHGSGQAFRADDPANKFHIPCLILAPGLEPRIEDRVTSQLDVVPTILDLLDWDVAHAGLGRSVLQTEGWEHHGALCNYSPILIRVEDEGMVLHNLQDRLEGSRAFKEGADLDGIERRLLSTLQVGYRLVFENRFCPIR